MEFRLTYEGRLGSGQSASAQHKHDIRRVFHGQLKKLWEVHPHLIAQEAWWGGQHAAIRRPERWRPDQPFARKDELAEHFRRGNYRFVPLVLAELQLYCDLDVLFLRPGLPGNTLNAGDIDNRIKTLFDALKMTDGLKGTPGENEDPFYVLLEDDRLITRLSVQTDTLLQPTGSEAGPQDARLTITVRLSPYHTTVWNVGF